MGPAAPFPYDLFHPDLLPAGPVGDLVRRLDHLSLKPPYPWGQWLYARLLAGECAGLDGDVVECGVAKGGMSLFLGHLVAGQGRTVYACDSFAGLPPPDPVRDNRYFREGDYRSAVPGTDLLARFRSVVAEEGLGGTVVPVAGYFSESLHRLPAGLRICFLHIDADLYASVTDALEALYDRVVDGGVVVVDDYFHHAQGPKRAAADFFNGRDLAPLHYVSFPYSVFVVKGETWHRSRLHRAIDGNFYSLDSLRWDAVFVEAVERCLAAAEAGGGPPRAVANCRMLRDLLRTPACRSSDVYAYWRCLEDFWDGMSGAAALGGTAPARAPILLG